MNWKSNTFSKFANDANVRGVFFQVVLIAALVFFFLWLTDNTLTNLSNQGKSLGFAFLSGTAGFQISQTFGTWLFDVFCGVSSLRRAKSELLSTQWEGAAVPRLLLTL